MASQSIVVEGLGKSYGDFWALDGIDFSVEPGEIVGFLGPNGAGKTTTMKILTCFMAATKGSAKVAGFDVYDESEQARKKIGYLPESVPLYGAMMVYDYLKFIAEIRGIPSDQRKARIKKVVELTGLTPMVNRNIEQLSKGYRQRVGLAQAIIHEPDVVILDEPTSGLDPNQIIEIRDLIKEIGKEKTVIFSTHILQEVAAVCDRIIVINKGKIVADGTVESLSTLVADAQAGLLVGAKNDIQNELEQISDVTSVHPITDIKGEFRYRVETANQSSVRETLFSKHGSTLVSVESFAPTLEDVFRALTGDDPIAVTTNDTKAVDEDDKDWSPTTEEE